MVLIHLLQFFKHMLISNKRNTHVHICIHTLPCVCVPAVTAAPVPGVTSAGGHSLAVAAGVTLGDCDCHKSGWE